LTLTSPHGDPHLGLHCHSALYSHYTLSLCCISRDLHVEVSPSLKEATNELVTVKMVTS